MNAALEYRISGPPDAPWLTLSHPIGAHLGIWDAQIPALTQRYRVLAFSTRGHGGSPAGPASCRIEELAADVRQLWQGLGIQHSHFVGLSLGGCIGVALALQSPESVRSLAVACSRLEMDAGASAMWEQRATLVEQQGMEAVVTPTLERWFTPAFLAGQAATVNLVRRMLQACPPAGFAASARALAQLHLEARLPHLQVPSLFLAGRDDQAVGAAMVQYYASLVPGARYAALPGPHILHLENPAGFSHGLLGFLDLH